jgi:phosphatidyl-myo-inositol dimannoside synthase
LDRKASDNSGPDDMVRNLSECARKMAPAQPHRLLAYRSSTLLDAKVSDGFTMMFNGFSQASCLPSRQGQKRAEVRKILVLSEVFPPKTGGSGRWFWEIYRRMPRESVMIAAGEDRRQEEFDQTHDLHMLRLPLTLPSYGVRHAEELRAYWRPLRLLGNLVVRHQVGVVHCGRCLPEGLMAMVLKYWRGLPYACYAHGEELNQAASSRELTWLLRRVLRGARLVIANSRNTASLLRHTWGLPESKLQVLNPGVDTRRFVPAGRDPKVRQNLGWENRTVILTVGRLQKRKGHDKMIQGLRAVKQTIPNVLYAIVGEGEERESLRELVAREGANEHVQFLGEVDDQQLVRCYQQCDLFVLANRQVGVDFEGFGMVLLEAQACGKPVVAGESGGTAETMSIPQTGRVICCEEHEPLADLVIQLLKNCAERERMGSAARQWVVEHFDWGALSRRAALIFQRLQADPHLFRS